MKKILIIEDTEDVREIISDTLTYKGYTVFAAADGTTGVELAARELPDLVICDIHMPNMDGFDTLAALRKTPSTAVIPFIFLSGVADRSHIRRGMDLGADDYLTKPFSAEELIAAVVTRLEKQEGLKRHTEQKLEELRGAINMALPHELRTPLNGILGLSSLLLEDGQTMDRQQVLETARYIHNSALRLHRLIENFLVYSQIEVVAADPDRRAAMRQSELVPVGELIGNLVRQKAEKAGRTADLSGTIQPAEVPVSEDHLKKIVEELVENAFKFSEPGSPVSVSTSTAGDFFTLSIADRGRGMTAEQIANVGAHMQFERKFYEQQGAGLGLIIAKRLTELLGGQFRIASAPGEHTTVEVIFPLKAG